MLKFGHVVSFLQDIYFTVPTFDFYFKFMIPKPNKERLILERDSLGIERFAIINL